MEQFRLTSPDGKIGHAEIRIGPSNVMLSDEWPDFGALSPPTIGGSPVKLHLYVDDADTVVARAVAAGATLLAPVADQFYGDRSGMVADPFGHTWFIATPERGGGPRGDAAPLDRRPRRGGRRLSSVRRPEKLSAAAARRVALAAQGFVGPRPDRVPDAARPAAAGRAARAAADRLGQRRRPLPLSAAVLPPRSLSRASCWTSWPMPDASAGCSSIGDTRRRCCR